MAKKKVTTTTVVEEIIDDKKPTAARILVVLDRSGSMVTCLDEAIGGFNAFLKDQQALPGECQMSIMLFDDSILDLTIDTPIASVQPLSKETFVPRGFTGLYDAVGTMIQRYQHNNKSGVKTILVILTDGQENSSKMHTLQSVGAMIKRVESEHGWETLFLGSGFNVNYVADTLNIKAMNRMQFDANSIGQTTSTYTAASGSTIAYRSGAVAVDLSAVNVVEEAEKANLS